MLDFSSRKQLPYDIRIQAAPGKEIPFSAFGELLRKNLLQKRPRSIQAIASEWVEPGIDSAASRGLTAQGATTRLLLDLGMLLWREQTLQWQQLGKAWTSEAKIIGTVRWYLLGQGVGLKPIFHGICSHCGQLLYGTFE